MRAFVNPDTCIGCTLCVQMCPAIFRMNTDKAVTYKDPVPALFNECARKAAEECPVTAISIEE